MRGSSRCGRWLALVFAMLLASQSAQPVWAWGRLGHRVISRIAEKHLTPKTREAVKALLPEGETLADASTWADEYRVEHSKIARFYAAGRGPNVRALSRGTLA
jgi:hypothetical protein